MKTWFHRSPAKATAAPAGSSFRPRPFGEAEPAGLAPQPDSATQLDRAARFGHHFARVKISSGQSSSAPIQAKWILRNGEPVEVPDEYELQENETLTSPSELKKRKQEEVVVPETDFEPVKKQKVQKNPMSALLQTGQEKNLFSYLSALDTVQVSQVSKDWNKAAKTKSIVPKLMGRRQVGNVDMWSTEPVSEPKRYFKPMSGTGQTPSVPHISEQVGHPKHLTDVASINWPNVGSGLSGGNYPSKIQFHEDQSILSTSNSYHLETSPDLPKKPQQGRVLMPAPPILKEPKGTYIETKSKNKALTGNLPPSYPRTHLTPEQVTKTLQEAEDQWKGKKVIRRDRPL